MRAITNISCIGAGLIGQGWATQFCSSGYDLVLYDVNAAILETALGQIKSNLMFLETHELLDPGEAAGANVKSIKAMEFVRTKSLAEIKTWRDEMLVKVLKLINPRQEI